MNHQDQITNDTLSNDTEEGRPDKEKTEWPDSPTSADSFSHGKLIEEGNDVEQRIIDAGEAKYHRLGWKRLTIMLIVEAIALGSLSMPSAFATLGMVAGVICSVGVGMLAIYTSYIIGQVKLAYPFVRHYGDAGTLMMGRTGYELFTAMFLLQLIFVTGSHCLTGTIAFRQITGSDVCSLVFGIVSAIILLLLAIPSSFADMAFLGYIDFASIIGAIGITVIATGIKASNEPGGLPAVNWSPISQDSPTFAQAFIAITNIVFAYSFATCQFSFMDEMHTPKDYIKSIWALGLLQIVIYTITGVTIYAFVGQDVKSPALLSAGTMISRIALGVALPVIFISGSINIIVAGRLIHGRIYENSVIRYVNTPKAWIAWLAVISSITVISWIIAEAIPFFSDLLSISSSLFASGFSFYIPPVMWLMLLRKGKWYSKENVFFSVVNGLVFIIGIVILVGGLYSSIQDVRSNYKAGKVHGAFSCGPV
ncbi:transmembrane amino acid transporter protein-domain-containing protein [Aspergillus alliaceus]|uniref:transmembrane amino acid transporter protein-domain-containing protein n=1 Tax=Petromyces alliaceus TaxID=209559 RepID=UPI0012A5304A|nr:transmembrane amino acid transporter protein-domain-containing protein [Aspergillus alliaceus]KAB8235747.1 transmembrane amino acid transporter protein-domain-containing protein [Aspergillus alliaceus]